MQTTLYTASSGLSAADLKLNYIANDLANAETTAYKAQRPEFAALVAKHIRQPSASEGAASGGLSVGTGVQAIGTITDFSQGMALQTNRELDLMIQGDGFFKVIKEDGTELFTRNGALILNEDGELSTFNNYILEPSISVPDNATAIEVDRMGRIVVRYSDDADGEEIGQLELYRFINPNGLLQVEGGLYAATESSGDEIVGTPDEDSMGFLIQGYQEGSNVDTITAMIDLMNTQRTFEQCSKALDAANSNAQTLTQVV